MYRHAAITTLLAAAAAAVALMCATATAADIATASVSGAAAIDLQLTDIKARVMKQNGWTAAHTDAVANEYRKFWWLHKTHPTVNLVPSLDVDEMWHAHILFTMKYAADCERIFGSFFHHHPTVDGDADTSALNNKKSSDYSVMLSLYEREFNAKPNQVWSRGGRVPAAGGGAEQQNKFTPASCGSSCGSSCSSSSCTGGGNGTAPPPPPPPMSMSMGTLHFATAESSVLFESWNFSGGSYAGFCIALIIACVFKEFLFAWRSLRLGKTAKKRRSGETLIPGSTPPGIPLFERAFITLLYIINLFFGYMIMLVLMSYNWGFIFAILFGSLCGHFVFNWVLAPNGATAPEVEAECCEK